MGIYMYNTQKHNWTVHCIYASGKLHICLQPAMFSQGEKDFTESSRTVKYPEQSDGILTAKKKMLSEASSK